MLWDIFCRVVDNFGDVGVCWRAAADLASRGERVRLWLDDASALAWMAPGGRPGVEVISWSGEPTTQTPGDVVIEAFGSNPPDEFVARMAQASRPPVWINLEYLSAEDYVVRSHALPALLDVLAQTPTLLLSAAGIASTQVERCLGTPLARGALRAVTLPHLTQSDYDHLLWSCDLNFVRGEDSFVRAQWAAKPFVWQIYRQDDHAHAVKLAAFNALFLAGAPSAVADRVRAIHATWNGLGDEPPDLPPLASWQGHCESWREDLLGRPDLIGALLGFVLERR